MVYVLEKRKKSQSAMEYLMTYGWSIIIILVVLGVLYILNVFNPQGTVGTICSSNFKYSCISPFITTNGLLTFTLGQNTGSTEYNIAVACAKSQNSSTGAPLANGTSPWRYVNSTGVLFSNQSSSFVVVDPLVGKPLFLQSQQTFAIRNLQCYDQNGNPIGGRFSRSPAIGSPITTKIWIKFTNDPGGNSTTNPYVEVLVFTLSTTVGVSK